MQGDPEDQPPEGEADGASTGTENEDVTPAKGAEEDQKPKTAEAPIDLTGAPLPPALPAPTGGQEESSDSAAKESDPSKTTSQKSEPSDSEASKSSGSGDGGKKASYDDQLNEAALELGTSAYVQKRIESLRAGGIPAALFLGSSTTGKTWLMQRMKHQLIDDYDCKPPLAIGEKARSSAQVKQLDEEEIAKEVREEFGPADDITDEEKLVADERMRGSDTGGTSSILIHRFLPVAHDGYPFALIDVPGEQVEKLAQEAYSTQRGLLMALEYATVIIIALPTDVMFFEDAAANLDEKEHEKPQKLLQELVDEAEILERGLANIAYVRSLIKQRDIKVKWKPPGAESDDFDKYVTPEAVEELRLKREGLPVGGPDGKDCPTFFALTKADHLFATIDEVPDAGHVDPIVEKRLRKANDDLVADEYGAFLKALYPYSALNPSNRRGRTDPLSRAWRYVIGAGNLKAPISNPTELMREQQRGLFNRLTTLFPMSRFDLISAFYGNTASTLEKKDFARMEAVGVKELVDWVSKANVEGINEWHVWARSVFRRIYPPSGMRNMFMVSGEYATRRRLKFLPPGLLDKMYRKEWHVARWLPGIATLICTALTLSLIFNPVEDTSKFNDGELYEQFMARLDRVQERATGNDYLEALAELPRIPEGVDPAQAAEWSPIDGLKGWKAVGSAYTVKNEYVPATAVLIRPDESETSQDIDFLRANQIDWQERYVCGLEGWGPYRPIVRKAVIQGYGDCGLGTWFALRSTAIDFFASFGSVGIGIGGLLGLLAIALSAALTYFAATFAVWHRKSRKAFEWLYHSRSATTQH
ncbi:MAG: hypothetical protein AAF249_03005 [Pseudomonadota bacterium]